MVQKIVIMFIMLSIFKEYTGVQCDNHISEYTDVFNLDAIDEFHLICYMSMQCYIQGILSKMNETQYQRTIALISEVYQFNLKLLRVNNWQKYLKEPLKVWANFKNIRKWSENPNDDEIKKFILEEAKLTNNGDEFRDYNLTTTIVTFPTKHLEQFLSNEFMQITHNRIPVSGSFGYVILLMKDDDYFRFIPGKHDDDQAMSLLYIIDDALQDMYISMVNTLPVINMSRLQNSGTHTFNHELMKIMITIFCKVVKLTEMMFHTKDIRGVPEKLYEMYQTKTDGTFIYSSYDYETFKNDFQQIYREKISDEPQVYKPNAPIFSNGRLIKYGKVDPSIIGYYAIYDESWEDLEAIDYTINTDVRLVFLLELNAWAIVLYQMLQELRESLEHRGLQDSLSDKPDFVQDIDFIYQSN